jgi:hypothetical protein
MKKNFIDINKSDEPRLTVVFGTSKTEKEIAPDTIMIVFSTNSWNDFGHSARAEFYICGRRGGANGTQVTVNVNCPGYIGFLSKQSEDNLIEKLKKLDSLVLKAGDTDHYFTMLHSMEEYRAIVSAFGKKYAQNILKSLNDLVAHTELNTSANWVTSATNTEVFKRSFLRQSESYFAFKNAGSVLRGLDAENFSSISQSLSVSFKLENTINDHELTFKEALNKSTPTQA